MLFADDINCNNCDNNDNVNRSTINHVLRFTHISKNLVANLSELNTINCILNRLFYFPFFTRIIFASGVIHLTKKNLLQSWSLVLRNSLKKETEKIPNCRFIIFFIARNLLFSNQSLHKNSRLKVIEHAVRILVLIISQNYLILSVEWQERLIMIGICIDWPIGSGLYGNLMCNEFPLVGNGYWWHS